MKTHTTPTQTTNTEEARAREMAEEHFVAAGHRVAEHFGITIDGVPELIGLLDGFERHLSHMRTMPLENVIKTAEWLEKYADNVEESKAQLSEAEVIDYRLLAVVNKLAATLDITRDEVVQGVGHLAKHDIPFWEVRDILRKLAWKDTVHEPGEGYIYKDDTLQFRTVLKYERLLEMIETRVPYTIDMLLLDDDDVVTIISGLDAEEADQ